MTCIQNKKDCINGEHEFGKVKTAPQKIHDLIVEKEPQRFVLEACTITGWVVDIAEALGKETETANTTHDAWRWKNVKKEKDRHDVPKLAKLSAVNQLPVKLFRTELSNVAEKTKSIYLYHIRPKLRSRLLVHPFHRHQCLR